MSRYLVTGASGYIASQIVKRLVDENHEVCVVLRMTSGMEMLKSVESKIKVLRYDGKLEHLIDFFCQEKPDYVIHLASLFVAEHKSEQVDDLIASNVLFGTQILESMKCSGTRFFINTATSWQHYEGEEYNPVCLYAATKQAFEDVLKYYVEAGYIQAITLTVFDSYGPGDPRGKLISLFERTASSASALKMSAGEQEIDLIYIEDIVNGYVRACEMFQEGKVKNEVYCLNSDHPLKLKEVAAVFEKVYDVTLPIMWGQRPYRKREVMATYKEGIRLLGWEAAYSLEEGLKVLRNEKYKD